MTVSVTKLAVYLIAKLQFTLDQLNHDNLIDLIQINAIFKCVHVKNSIEIEKYKHINDRSAHYP